MREDFSEDLEKKFPKGFVIMYIQNNNEPAYHWYNPNQDEFLLDYLDALNHIFFGDQLSEEETEDY